jgi:hypothetical protein
MVFWAVSKAQNRFISSGYSKFIQGGIEDSSAAGIRERDVNEEIRRC